MKSKERGIYWGVIVIALVWGILVTYSWQHEKNINSLANRYPLLSKRIFTQSTNDLLLNFGELREQIRGYFDSVGLKHSFYFEYLPSGISIRDDDTTELAAASLMKIPLVMDLYRAAEKGRLNLDEKLAVTSNELNFDENFGNAEALSAGDELTLREATKITLTKSDNTAARFINDRVSASLPEEDKSLQYLDLPATSITTDQGKYLSISAKSYSSLLKCLYLSCLLTPDHSQEILSYLSQSENRNRLPSGIPQEVTVINKIGTFSDQSQSDCAIVYVPNRPFLICAMFYASDNIDHHFKQLAAMTYNFITEAKAPPAK